MLKIGHRGAKGYIAENTIESIEKAFCLNINAIEIDVHKCATDEILVFHDFTLNRITNGNGEIASFPFSYITSGKIKNEQIIVSSFQRIELEAIYKINPDLKLGVLTQASVSEALSFAKKIKAYAIHPNYTLLTKANVLKAQSEGYKVITWTVNELSDIEMVKNLGVDGIISDFPDRL